MRQFLLFFSLASNLFLFIYRCNRSAVPYEEALKGSNISKTSASVSSGVPNTEKQMKARGRWPSAFIDSRFWNP